MRAWIGVVSRTHVRAGVDGGFAQLCHGRAAPLRAMRRGDWLVYYSPRVSLEGGEPCRAFTAIGEVSGEETYAFDMGGGFVPARRNVRYLEGARDAPLAPLLDALNVARGLVPWNALVRRGVFDIDAQDLACIARAMGVELPAAVLEQGRRGRGAVDELVDPHDRRGADEQDERGRGRRDAPPLATPRAGRTPVSLGYVVLAREGV